MRPGRILVPSIGVLTGVLAAHRALTAAPALTHPFHPLYFTKDHHRPMAYGEKKLEGGYAASHKQEDPFPILVAPSLGKEKNTIRQELITIACWKIDDVRFYFDSSFVLPAAKPEFEEFAA